MCRTLLKSPPLPSPSPSPSQGAWESAGSPQAEAEAERFGIDPRSSLSGRDLSIAPQGKDRGTGLDNEQTRYLAAIRDWKACIEGLLEALRNSLAETYQNYEPDATAGMVEALFGDVDFRASAIQGMRNARIEKIFPKGEGFSGAKYDVRFRNYDRVKKDLVDITRVLRMGETGLFGERYVEDVEISPRGDVVLEFANKGADAGEGWVPGPVLRFRVSSWMLAETSPVFARMFTDHANIVVWDDEDFDAQLPPSPPSPFTCRDGSEARLYRMPQRERDAETSLTILLHAAHMHNDEVPREVSFERFVAIAETCWRYRCTSPLEVFVEHGWLPQWIHMGSQEMPDGMLAISYVFGFRQLFARMSKTVVLNLEGEEEVWEKRPPRSVKERVLGLRRAKMGQVEDACETALREYLGRSEVSDAGKDCREDGPA